MCIRDSLLNILEDNAGSSFNRHELLGASKKKDSSKKFALDLHATVASQFPNFEFTTAKPQRRLPTSSAQEAVSSTFAALFPTTFTTTAAPVPTTRRFRLRLPTTKSKVMHVQRPVPVEEVTFERVPEDLFTQDRQRQGIRRYS